MKVLYYQNSKMEDIQYLRKLLPNSIIVKHISPDKKDEIISCANQFDAVVGARLPDYFLKNAVNLKYFIIPFTGLPQQDKHIFDKYPYITVINSHFNYRYVAEHAWALLMASAKRLVPIHNKLIKGDWSPRYQDYISISLEGKTLLILGYGRIGKQIGKIGKCFGMYVEGIKRNKVNQNDEEIDFIGTNDDLEERLPRADFIVIVLPLTQETKGYFGAKEFSLIKKGAYLINAGRGAVIDELALYSALKKDKLGGVALDTWWVYPKDKDSQSSTMPSNFPLHEFENVVFSPHIASQVIGSEKKRMESIAEILKSIKSNKKIYPVNMELGY